MSDQLEKNVLGRTGLEVTQLGYGAMAIRGPQEELSDRDAEDVLNGVLDAGINFIDTAPDYGLSEDRIGAFISGRRDEYTLATKCGCNMDYPSTARKEPPHLWQGDMFLRNVENSLRRMKTDHVDILQMHNPSPDEVIQNGLVEALEKIRASGKARFISVSSTAPHLMEYVRMGAFDTFQIPYSAMERTHETMIQAAADAGAGIIIRGGIGKGHRASDERWKYWDTAKLDELCDGMNRYEFVLRFTLSHPACHTTIVGTRDTGHLQANLAAAKAGPLPADVYAEAARRLDASGQAPAAV